MAPSLEITIEDGWRGSILATVRPVANLHLIPQKSFPGLYSLGDEYSLKLLSGENVLVWCALTPQNQVKFSLKQGELELISLKTEMPFYAQARMSDGKLYQFSVKNDS